MCLLWTCAGINCPSLGEEPKISPALKIARGGMVVISLSYWVMIATCLFGAGHFHTPIFMLTIAFLVGEIDWGGEFYVTRKRLTLSYYW